MTTHTHNCAATGCQKQVPLNLLMCMAHWRMVPAPTQREVLATWRVRRRRLGDCWTANSQHESACAAAIAAVHAKQHRKIAEKTARNSSLFD
jgi:hypothetical protein